MFSTHSVRGHGENSVAQRRDIAQLWQLAALMDSDCSGVWGGLDNIDNCSNHIVFSCETSIRVYISHTLIKEISNGPL